MVCSLVLVFEYLQQAMRFKPCPAKAEDEYRRRPLADKVARLLLTSELQDERDRH